MYNTSLFFDGTVSFFFYSKVANSTFLLQGLQICARLQSVTSEKTLFLR